MAPGADDPSALLAAGRVKLAAGETLNALLLLQQACARLPESAEAFFLLGAARHRARQLPEALAAFDHASALDASQAQAALGALAVLCELGRTGEARTRAGELVARHPDDALVHYNVALIHELLGELEAAAGCYDAALRFRPGFREALLNRGNVLARLGRLDAARDNNLRLVSAHPDWAESHYNLAEICLALSRYAEALAASDQALTLASDHGGAHRDRGLALAALGRLEEAEKALAHARALGAEAPRPGGGFDESGELHAGEVFVIRAYERLEACDWSELDGLTRFASLLDDERVGPMNSAALGYRAMVLGLALPRQLQLARQIASRWESVPAAASSSGRSTANGRIRVGYVSSDFRDHPMGHLIAPLIEHHYRTRFEIFAYALMPDDGSEYPRRIRAASGHFADFSAATNDDLARAIRGDAIDVLVNLNGYMTGHRTALFAMRPAPIQVSYFGFPATMGASFIDYLVADRVVVPEDEAQWYAESLVWLPHCYFSGDRDEAVPPAPARGAAGLPERGVVFCDFNQHVKITPELFATWMRILARVPESVLWLLVGAGDARLRTHAQAAGIDPRRLVFAPRLPRREHLARLQLADLFLDTRPCNAHTTTTDALRAGVPVLTCPGTTFAGRVAASLARAAGLAELVVADLPAYEELAVALAGDPDRLGALRRRLQAGLATLPALDVAARARELERAYATMVERHRRGLPPAAFGVPSAG